MAAFEGGKLFKKPFKEDRGLISENTNATFELTGAGSERPEVLLSFYQRMLRLWYKKKYRPRRADGVNSDS